MKYKLPSLNRNYLSLTILIILVAGALAVGRFAPLVSINQGFTLGDVITGVGLIIAIAGFTVTSIQFVRAQRLQQAVNVKDFLTEFQKNGDLYGAYFDLVYCYIDSIYDDVEAAANEYMRRNGNAKPPAKIKPVFDCFEHLQKNKEAGRRFYHPLFFQFSDEEKKLDSLLDYFNAVGFYLCKGQIKMEDVVALLGDYLAVLADRKIIAAYLRLCNSPAEWKYDDTVGASTPFPHLHYLIESYKEYNSRAYKKKRDAMVQEAIKQSKERRGERQLDAAQ